MYSKIWNNNVIGTLMIFLFILQSTALTESTLNILVPNVKPLLYEDSVDLKGIALILKDQLGSNAFNLIVNSDYLEYDNVNLASNTRFTKVCLSKLQSGEVNYCLFPETLQLLNVTSENNEVNIVTTPWGLTPTIITQKENTTSNQIVTNLKPPSHPKFFLNPFYSSVWSLLFLYFLVGSGLLIVFEYTYPFGYKLHSLWGKSPDTLTLLECPIVVLSSIFMATHSKKPKSPAGILFLLIWNFFSIIIVAVYISGVLIQLISNSFTQQLQERKFQTAYNFELPFDVNDRPLVCLKNSLMCDLIQKSGSSIYIKNINKAKIQSLFKRVAEGDYVEVDSMSQALNKIVEGRALFLTDSLHMIDLMNPRSTTQGQNVDLSILISGKLTTRPLYNFAMVCNSGSHERTMRESLLRMKMRMTEPPEGLKDFTEYTKSDVGPDINSIKYWIELLQQVTPVRMITMNGPFLFMIIGAILSILTLLNEFIYRSLITKEYLKIESKKKQKEVTIRTTTKNRPQKSRSLSFNEMESSSTVRTTII